MTTPAQIKLRIIWQHVQALTLKVPVLGVLMRKIAVARFCRTLSTLLASGVSILEALDITARTSGNAVVEEAIQTTRKSIERGETIAAPLKDTAVFPPMVVQMIGVGEQTGALDQMLNKIADFYEEEVDAAVAGLLTLMEPVIGLVTSYSWSSLTAAMILWYQSILKAQRAGPRVPGPRHLPTRSLAT